MTGLYGNVNTRPDHFLVLKQIAHGNTLEHFVSSLDKVVQDKSNLLHLAIANGRDEKFIKLLGFFNVSLYEKDRKGRTPIDIAREKNHPSLGFLLDLKEMKRSPIRYKAARDSFLKEKLGERQAQYVMKDYSSEAGVARYVPELHTFRVVDGVLTNTLDERFGTQTGPCMSDYLSPNPEGR